MKIPKFKLLVRKNAFLKYLKILHKPQNAPYCAVHVRCMYGACTVHWGYCREFCCTVHMVNFEYSVWYKLFAV